MSEQDTITRIGLMKSKVVSTPASGAAGMRTHYFIYSVFERGDWSPYTAFAIPTNAGWCAGYVTNPAARNGRRMLTTRYFTPGAAGRAALEARERRLQRLEIKYPGGLRPINWAEVQHRPGDYP